MTISQRTVSIAILIQFCLVLSTCLWGASSQSEFENFATVFYVAPACILVTGLPSEAPVSLSALGREVLGVAPVALLYLFAARFHWLAFLPFLLGFGAIWLGRNGRTHRGERRISAIGSIYMLAALHAFYMLPLMGFGMSSKPN